MQNICNSCGAIKITGNVICWQCGIKHEPHFTLEQQQPSRQADNNYYTPPANQSNITHASPPHPSSFRENYYYPPPPPAPYYNPYYATKKNNLNSTCNNTKPQINKTGQIALGILNILFGISGIGLILGIIALVFVSGANSDSRGENKFKTAKTLNFIGVLLNILVFFALAIIIIIFVILSINTPPRVYY